MRGSQNPHKQLDRLRAESIRAARGESVDPAIVIATSDKDIARLLCRSNDEGRAGLLRLLASVGARGRRIAEHALHAEDCPPDAAREVLRFLGDRFPDHEWHCVFAQLASAADENVVTAALPLFAALPPSLVKVWADQHVGDLLRKGSADLHELLVGSPDLAAIILPSVLRIDADPGTLEFVARLAAESSPRSLRKAARAVLFRLAQRGIELPTAEYQAGPEAERSLETEAYISAIDPSGDQGVWVIEELPEGGFRVLQAIIDEDGAISSARVVGVERRGRDQLRESIVTGAGPSIAPLPALEAMGLLEAAFAANPTAVGREYRAWRHASQADRRSIRVALPEIVISDRASRLRESDQLLHHEACSHWLLTRSEAEVAEKNLGDAKQSPLLLPATETASRKSATLASTVRQIFGQTRRRRLARRLEGTAIYLHRQGETELARTALTTADALRQNSAEFPSILQGIIEKSLEVLLASRKSDEVSSDNES